MCFDGGVLVFQFSTAGGFARKVPSAKKTFSRKDAKAQRKPLETR
jgi:hypothetical protein